MKKLLVLILAMSVVEAVIFYSCQKEISCEGCNTKNQPPVANAGTDQTITLPTNIITLDGSASTDPDNNIKSYLWTKISGPSSFTIIHRDAVQTPASDLVKGIYEFELKVTDSSGLSDRDTVTITVNDMMQPNRPPVANAGKDTSITLPNNSIILDGSVSADPDNNIVSYQWTKISGPSSFAIANNTAVQTQASNLTEGVYQFELTVTDAGGLIDKDTITIAVNPEDAQLNLSKNVFFYSQDPTGTMHPKDPLTGQPWPWEGWVSDGGNVNLITIKIANLTDSLGGVWCKDGCSPDCSYVKYSYNSDIGNYAGFYLPPGAYNWSAENTTDFPGLLGATPEFINFFRIPHKVEGTITVNPEDNCIIQKIVFP
ncbi:MAG: hypothetical protein JST17_13795 [Bacteroidetes bacterium]|nr:hypothetical protein [Bacteroidota bacterium]MBS1930912.1 hypothetical protein [Bacteroidota bacterium]